MAQREELEIEIAADGTVKVRTHGVKGKACLEYVELLRGILGPVASQEPTPEFYEAEEKARTRITGS